MMDLVARGETAVAAVAPAAAATGDDAAAVATMDGEPTPGCAPPLPPRTGDAGGAGDAGGVASPRIVSLLLAFDQTAPCAHAAVSLTRSRALHIPEPQRPPSGESSHPNAHTD